MQDFFSFITKYRIPYQILKDVKKCNNDKHITNHEEIGLLTLMNNNFQDLNIIAY